MEGYGDRLIPTTSSLSLNSEGCETLQLQVVALLPSLPFSKTLSATRLRSLLPRLRVKTPSATRWTYSSAAPRREIVVEGSIQRALEQSPEADMISVPGGVYSEDLLITRPVTLVSTGQAKLFGRVTISASNVTLVGLGVYSVDPTQPGLYVTKSSHVLILDCRILRDTVTSHALLSVGVSAVSVTDSSHVSVVNSLVCDAGGCGVSLRHCSGCTVQTSVLERCGVGLRVAQCGRDLRVTGNQFRENGVAILLEESGGLETTCLRGNMFEDNLYLMSHGNGTAAVGSLDPETLVPKSLVPECMTARCGEDFASLDVSNGRTVDVIVTGTCSEEERDKLETCLHIPGEPSL